MRYSPSLTPICAIIVVTLVLAAPVAQAAQVTFHLRDAATGTTPSGKLMTSGAVGSTTRTMTLDPVAPSQDWWGPAAVGAVTIAGTFEIDLFLQMTRPTGGSVTVTVSLLHFDADGSGTSVVSTTAPSSFTVPVAGADDLGFVKRDFSLTPQSGLVVDVGDRVGVRALYSQNGGIGNGNVVVAYDNGAVDANVIVPDHGPPSYPTPSPTAFMLFAVGALGWVGLAAMRRHAGARDGSGSSP